LNTNTYSNFSNTNTKRMSRIRKHIRIFTRFGRQHVPFFIENLQLQNHVKTKIVVLPPS
jgi:hypothetical protein